MAGQRHGNSAEEAWKRAEEAGAASITEFELSLQKKPGEKEAGLQRQFEKTLRANQDISEVSKPRRPPKLDGAKQKIISKDIKCQLQNRDVLSSGQIVRLIGCSHQYVSKIRGAQDYVAELDNCRAQLLLQHIAKLDPPRRATSNAEPEPDNIERRKARLYFELMRRRTSFPVRSPFDDQIYDNPNDYAHHLAEKNLTFAPDELPETRPTELRNPSTRGYFRHLGPEAPEARAVFYYDTPLNDSFSSTGGFSDGRNGDGRLEPVGRVKIYTQDSPTVLVKNIDEDAKKRWPHEYAAFQAMTAPKATSGR